MFNLKNVMLMKKIALLLVGLLAMFSCEQENIEGIVNSSARQIETRAVESSIADFIPIFELEGIPVNILNVGNASRRYLSCVKSGSKVDLFTKDDGSLRQRWYVDKNNIILVGGNSQLTFSPYLGVMPNDKKESPILVGMTMPNMPIFSSFTGYNGDSYNIKGMVFTMEGGFSHYEDVGYLQAKDENSADLRYRMDGSSSISRWRIVPVGEYELVDLKYVYTSVDNFNPTEVICDRDTYENQSSSVVTWNYTVTTRYTESSSFSKTEGVSVSISNGLSVGLPSVEGSSSIGMNTTMQQQTSKSWTYGNSDSREITKTRTGNIPVQPHTTMKLEAVVFMYEGTVTYVATLRKIGDTRTFRVKGKWEGACYSDFKARTYDVTTGKLLNTYSLE